MPEKYARRMAELLSEDQAERVDVDLMDVAFTSEVAAALEALGLEVVVRPNRPTHLTLFRRKASP